MVRSSMVFVPALALACVLSACDAQDETAVDRNSHTEPDAAVRAELDELRASLERFRDVEVALAEGYIPDPMGVCEVAEMMGRSAEEGAMGIHYLRPDLLQITATEPRVDGMGTHTDFAEPAVLLYEPQADGSLELVGIENLTFQRAWEEAGNAEPPSFMGERYDHMVDDPSTEIDEGHHFEAHYDRHVWLFRENPNGVFAQFNPAVTCEHHEMGHGTAHAEANQGE